VDFNAQLKLKIVNSKDFSALENIFPILKKKGEENKKKVLVIGITGPSSSGKSTLSNLCKIHYLADCVHQDRFFDE
jgi:pantothenate kinase-related protein Tda10